MLKIDSRTDLRHLVDYWHESSRGFLIGIGWLNQLERSGDFAKQVIGGWSTERVVVIKGYVRINADLTSDLLLKVLAKDPIANF